MRLEIKSAVNFLTALLRSGQIIEDKLEFFSLKLQEVLGNHYRHHWFPDKPFKGSAYRCIRINHKMDPLISEAGSACGINESTLFNILPYELTLWIDPCEVSYRIGENGSVCVLLDSKSKSMERYTSAPTSCKETYSGLKESINMKFAAVVSS